MDIFWVHSTFLKKNFLQGTLVTSTFFFYALIAGFRTLFLFMADSLKAGTQRALCLFPTTLGNSLFRSPSPYTQWLQWVQNQSCEILVSFPSSWCSTPHWRPAPLQWLVCPRLSRPVMSYSSTSVTHRTSHLEAGFSVNGEKPISSGKKVKNYLLLLRREVGWTLLVHLIFCILACTYIMFPVLAYYALQSVAK